jgi:hypothetical protein
LNNNESNFKPILPLGVELKKITFTKKQLKKLHFVNQCGWMGCGAVSTGKPYPDGWMGMLIYIDNPLLGEIDSVLCPDHVKALNSVLRRDLHFCDWRDCECRFKGKNSEMPKGWKAFYIDKAEDEPGTTGINFLCPDHITTYQTLMKNERFEGCDWQGCGNSPSENAGWKKITVFDMTGGKTDAFLCADHAKSFEQLLVIPKHGDDEYCLVEGCKAHYHFQERGKLPNGWRGLSLVKDKPYKSLHDQIKDLLENEVGNLCPVHLKEVAKYLKFGYRLDLMLSETEAKNPN